MERPILQVALDMLELGRALQIAEEAVDGGADWVEAGTPLIKSAGMEAIRALRGKFPDREIVADMKVADTGALEVEMAAKAGASVVCVLGEADDSVIADAVQAASCYGVRLMADMLNVPNPVDRARELAGLGIDIINAHAGIDQQMTGRSSVGLVGELREAVTVPVAVAGGLNAEGAAAVVRMGADIVIVGSAIVRSADVKKSAARIRAMMDSPGGTAMPPVTGDDGIREIFSRVSTPNISDAMHRKGAMTGIISVCGNVKAAGPALTVQTSAGDWAKPVEAIDLARPGDVIVINNDRGIHVAPWGELATLSCIERGIAGVVIDGAVRDVDDIRALRFPVFARGTVPNAGDPKGLGEIGTEITCCSQSVRPGDWIVGDESGVVVVPRERAYEIARRALEVRKNEERLREEIKRGSTLSQVSELIRWEKKQGRER